MRALCYLVEVPSLGGLGSLGQRVDGTAVDLDLQEWVIEGRSHHRRHCCHLVLFLHLSLWWSVLVFPTLFVDHPHGDLDLEMTTVTVIFFAYYPLPPQIPSLPSQTWQDRTILLPNLFDSFKLTRKPTLECIPI